VAVTWLADLNKPPVAIGSTPTGLSMGFALPLNGFGTLELLQVQVFWNCSECVDPFNNNQVKVVAHPLTGYLGVTDYPQYNLLPGVGLTALICPMPVPTEDTTWGKVKAIYGE
jgi:hypothetical protein